MAFCARLSEAKRAPLEELVGLIDGKLKQLTVPGEFVGAGETIPAYPPEKWWWWYVQVAKRK